MVYILWTSYAIVGVLIMGTTIENLDTIEHNIADLQDVIERLPEWDEIYHSLEDWIKDNRKEVDYAAIRMLPAWYPEYREMDGHDTILVVGPQKVQHGAISFTECSMIGYHKGGLMH